MDLQLTNQIALQLKDNPPISYNDIRSVLSTAFYFTSHLVDCLEDMHTAYHLLILISDFCQYLVCDFRGLQSPAPVAAIGLASLSLASRCSCTRTCATIYNSGENVFLISASVKGASHTYSRLSCRVLVGKSLLRMYGGTALTVYIADSILAIVLSS